MVSQQTEVAPPDSSGLRVIVVGLGYAGAVAAVECYRKGHHVTVFEQTSKVSEGGMQSTPHPSSRWLKRMSR